MMTGGVNMSVRTAYNNKEMLAWTAYFADVM